MSVADPISKEIENEEHSVGVDERNRQYAAYLMYAAAIFSIISIFIDGWLTSQWDLDLGFLIFWLCGHFLKQGTRSAVSAVNWSIVIDAESFPDLYSHVYI
ncbi:MAG: hypothetical protein HUJ26_09055 [Planctomycetaceae bacterium]|nr:hypothetical protein [Planctomycetaceae bacterium]